MVVATGSRRAKLLATSLASATMLAALTTSPALASRPARAASEMSIRETVRLRLAGHSGSTLIEQGAGTGTFGCHVRIALDIGAIIKADFTIHPSGGTIGGHGEARTHANGSRYVSFRGKLRVNSGAGRYAKASGSEDLYGVIDRSDDSLTVQIVGELHF